MLPDKESHATYPIWTEYQRMLPRLLASPEFLACREGVLDRGEFAKRTEAHLGELIHKDYRRYVFYSRVVPNDEVFVDTILESLHARGRILSTEYDKGAYDEVIKACCAFNAANYTTYIHPEEARLTFALAQIIAPSRIVSVGSYFGFWSLIALAGAKVTLPNSCALFIDVNPSVCELAHHFSEHLNLNRDVKISSTSILEENNSELKADLYLLDAETDFDHPDPELRYKAIYGPLVQRISKRAPEGAFLLAHNFLTQNLYGLQSLENILAYNRDNLASFMHETAKMCWSEEIDTCEGIGFYRW